MPDARFDDYPEEQAVALTALLDSISSLQAAFSLVFETGLKPAEALEACGYPIPLMARPMVNTLLAAEHASS